MLMICTKSSENSIYVYAMKYISNDFIADDKISLQPIERYFHAAVATDDYMIVLGGRTSLKDYDSSVLAYRYNCNHWTDLTTEGKWHNITQYTVLRSTSRLTGRSKRHVAGRLPRSSPQQILVISLSLVEFFRFNFCDGQCH